MFSLRRKNIFITGAASGIGQAVAETMLTEGARIAVFDVQEPAWIEAADDAIAFYQGSVTDETSLQSALARYCSSAGPLDVLINNAGISGDEAAIESTDLANFDRVLDINLRGVLIGLKHGLPLVRDGGSVINTASLAASATLPGYAGYSVSKAGVVKLTQQAAMEAGGRGIRVNAVCPGTTLTPMEPADGDEARLCAFATALERPASTAEQVGAYLFLASDASRYVSGQAINVDGGWLHGLTPRFCEEVLGQ